MQEEAERPGNIAIILLLGIAGVLIVGFINWHMPVLRLSSDVANYIVGTLLFALPLCVPVLLLFARGHRIIKVLASLFTIPIALVLLLPSAFCAMQARNVHHDGVDYVHERFDSIKTCGSQLTAYRGNGGATTALSVEVRHEWGFAPGILLVRTVFSEYPCGLVTLSETVACVVVIHAIGACGDRGGVTEVRLRRFVYF